MMMAIGLSQYNVALMHTVNHAFFKALLFLGAGAVIHSFADQQDVRKMGGLIKFLPFTYSVMLTGSLSLLATPYLTGFYSKDLILELAFGQYNFSGIYAYILGSITAGITAFYSFRLISLVFLTTPNGNKQSYINSYATLTHPSLAQQPLPLAQARKLESSPHSHSCDSFCKAEGGSNSSFESLSNTNTYSNSCYSEGGVKEGDKLNLIVNFPLLFLALFSIFFGFVFSDLFVGMGSDFFKNSIFIHPKNISLIEAEFSLQSSFSTPLSQLSQLSSWESYSLGERGGGYNILFKLLPAILSITGALSAIILYHLPFLFLINCPASQKDSSHSCVPSYSYSIGGRGVAAQAVFAEGGAPHTVGSIGGAGYVGGVGITASQPPANKGEVVASQLPLMASTYNKIGRNIYAFLNGKYYFDIIYNHFIFQSGLKLGYNISKEIDRGAIELLGPYGLSNYFYNAGKNLAKLDTGVITTYSLYITIALISLLFILFSPAEQLALATNYLQSPSAPSNPLCLSSSPLSLPTALLGGTNGAVGSEGGANEVTYPQSLEEIRLFIIYITSALIVITEKPSA
jgi:NADH:ubiquinone oxidoreductase subunit 5 (subunit L)/multisubunit Na+/H+ antiporter MnhA subunit